MEDCQLPLDALPGEIVDRTRTRTRTPGNFSKSEASSLSRQPSYLKPQPPQACPGSRTSASYQVTATDSRSACLQPSAIAGECHRFLSLPQQPGPLSAQPFFRGSHPQGASPDQPAGLPFPWRPLCCTTLLCLQHLLVLPQLK